MEVKTIQMIKSNPILYRFLRENSSWYQRLNRNSNSIYEMEKEAKKYFKLTFSDRFQKVVDNIDMISTFMDVLK